MSIYYKTLSLFLLLVACSNVATDQKAFHYNNKGITCAGILDSKGQLVICGETSVFTSNQPATAGKEAFFVVTKNEGKDNTGYSLSISNNPSRFERIIPFEKDYIIGGFNSETKNKMLIRTNDAGAAIWGIQSEKFRTFDPGDMCIDKSGNLLVMTKDPSAEAYHGTLHFIDKDGNCKWSRDMSSIEVMQDMIPCRDGHFLISYKQKGAFIDGSTRKKYWMNSFHKVDQSGQIIWSRKFHLENDLVDDCVFSKILEDKNGNLFFIGKLDVAQPRKQHLFVTKTDKDGRIFWSLYYDTPQELNFKTGCFDQTGNLILVADGYSKNGGMAFMQLAADGSVAWAKLFKTANYEQALDLIENKNSFTLIWDKLLNFATMSFNAKGQTCNKVDELTITNHKFPLLLDEFKYSWDNVEADWKKMEFNLVPHQDIKVSSDCQ
jgi:hypothetical protein